MPTLTVIEATKHERTEKVKCAAYCRVSSSSEDQLNSYQAQIRYFSGLFADSETEELVEVYADEGISGTSALKRAEFQRMMADCRRGKIDRIYTKSISRFARNYKDSLEALRELRELGVSVYFEEQNIDTIKTTDEMLIVVLSNLAQQESVSISQNLRWSVKKRMQKGIYEQSTPPYGYRKENGQLVIDDDEAEIVKDIFGWYLSGVGIRSIAARLNNRGVPTGNNGSRWHNHPVTYILTNERYTGNSLLQKTYKTDTLPFRSKKNKGEKEKYFVKDTHEAIISQEDYDKVQTLMKERGKLYYRENGTLSVFHKMIKCAGCGKTYIRKTVRGKVYWVCATHDLDAEACTSPRIPEEKLRAAFVTMVRKLKKHSLEILIPLRKSLRELKFRGLGADEKVLDIHKDVAKMKEQQAVIAELRTKGYLSEDKYQQQTSDLTSKIKRLKDKLRKYDKAYDDDKSLNTLDELIETINDIAVPITDFSDELFSEIVSDITVTDGSTIKFNLNGNLSFNEKLI